MSVEFGLRREVGVRSAGASTRTRATERARAGAGASARFGASVSKHSLQIGPGCQTTGDFLPLRFRVRVRVMVRVGLDSGLVMAHRSQETHALQSHIRASRSRGPSMSAPILESLGPSWLPSFARTTGSIVHKLGEAWVSQKFARQ